MDPRVCYFPITLEQTGDPDTDAISLLTSNTAFSFVSAAMNLIPDIPSERQGFRTYVRKTLRLPHQSNSRNYMAIYSVELNISDAGTGKTGSGAIPIIDALKTREQLGSYIFKFTTRGGIINIYRSYYCLPNKILRIQTENEIVSIYSDPGQFPINRTIGPTNSTYKSYNASRNSLMRNNDIRILPTSEFVSSPKISSLKGQYWIAFKRNTIEAWESFYYFVEKNYSNSLVVIDEAHIITPRGWSLLRYMVDDMYEDDLTEEDLIKYAKHITSGKKKLRRHHTYASIIHMLYIVCYYGHRVKLILQTATPLRHNKKIYKLVYLINMMRAILKKPPIINPPNYDNKRKKDKFIKDILSTTYGRTSYIAIRIPNSKIRFMGKEFDSKAGNDIRVVFVEMTEMETLWTVIELVTSGHSCIADIFNRLNIIRVNGANIQFTGGDKASQIEVAHVRSICTNPFGQPTISKLTKDYLREHKEHFESTLHQLLQNRRDTIVISTNMYTIANIQVKGSKSKAHEKALKMAGYGEEQLRKLGGYGLDWEWYPDDAFIDWMIDKRDPSNIDMDRGLATDFYQSGLGFNKFCSKMVYIMEEASKYDKELDEKYTGLVSATGSWCVKVIYLDRIKELYDIALFLEHYYGYNAFLINESLIDFEGNNNIITNREFDKNKRYAILTTTTPDTIRQNIIGISNSADNVLGEYIEWIFITKAYSTGFTLVNSLMEFVITAANNKRRDTQVTHRIIRANTSTNRIKFFRDKGIDIDPQDPIEIRIYRLIHKFNERLPDLFIGPDLIEHKLPEDPYEYDERIMELIENYKFYGDVGIPLRKEKEVQNIQYLNEKGYTLHDVYDMIKDKEIDYRLFDYRKYEGFIDEGPLKDIITDIKSTAFDSLLNKHTNKEAENPPPIIAPDPSKFYNDALLMMYKANYIDSISTYIKGEFDKRRVNNYHDLVTKLMEMINDIDRPTMEELLFSYIIDDGYLDRSRGVKLYILGDLVYRDVRFSKVELSSQKINAGQNYSIGSRGTLSSFIDMLNFDDIETYLDIGDNHNNLSALEPYIATDIVERIITKLWLKESIHYMLEEIENISKEQIPLTDIAHLHDKIDNYFIKTSNREFDGSTSAYNILITILGRKIESLTKNFLVQRNIYVLERFNIDMLLRYANENYRAKILSVIEWITETNDTPISRKRVNLETFIDIKGNINTDPLSSRGKTLIINIILPRGRRYTNNYRTHIIGFGGIPRVFKTNIDDGTAEWIVDTKNEVYRQGKFRLYSLMYEYESRYDIYLIKYRWKQRTEFRLRNKLKQDDSISIRDIRMQDTDGLFTSSSYKDQVDIMLAMGIPQVYEIYEPSIINNLRFINHENYTKKELYKAYTWFYTADSISKSSLYRFELTIKTAKLKDMIYDTTILHKT